MKTDEHILVVARDRLLPEAIDGFVRDDATQYMTAVRVHGIFRPRSAVEQDPSVKQIIPYLIVRWRDQVFLFQRSAAGGEPRLHGMFSIGVGGHINRDDVKDARDLVADGLRRELEEELIIPSRWRVRLVGVLNDDRNPVGRVHFGLVHIVEVESPEISVRDSDALTGRLASRKEILTVRERMETWSRLILDAADPTVL